MPSSVLPEKLNGPTIAMVGQIGINNSSDVVEVGELRVNGAPVPVYAIRRGKRNSSFARAILMKIWWSFGKRFWPCAESDGEW
jgi:hypothetical protein